LLQGWCAATSVAMLSCLQHQLELWPSAQQS
jgi:hypothetical protein